MAEACYCCAPPIVGSTASLLSRRFPGKGQGELCTGYPHPQVLRLKPYLLSIRGLDREGYGGAVGESVGHGQARDESRLVLRDGDDGLGLVEVLVLVEVVAELIELQSLYAVCGSCFVFINVKT